MRLAGGWLAKGRGTVLAKSDVEGAFKTVPVHPGDIWLLGKSWEGHVYVDKVLPFGLRSAPKLYNAVADALLWILENSDEVEESTTWTTFFCLATQTACCAVRPGRFFLWRMIELSKCSRICTTECA